MHQHCFFLTVVNNFPWLWNSIAEGVQCYSKLQEPLISADLKALQRQRCTALQVSLEREVEQEFIQRGNESTERILWVYPKKSQCPIIIILSVDARSNYLEEESRNPTCCIQAAIRGAIYLFACSGAEPPVSGHISAWLCGTKG